MSDDEHKCEIYTAKGKPCPYNASKTLKIVDKAVCNIHEKLCKVKYSEYKDVCNKVWDKSCYSKLDDKEIQQIKRFAEICHKHRIEFSKNCCNGKIDKGHHGAIQKMENLIEKCEREEDRREQQDEIKEFGSRSSNSRSTYSRNRYDAPSPSSRSYSRYNNSPRSSSSSGSSSDRSWRSD